MEPPSFFAIILWSTRCTMEVIVIGLKSPGRSGFSILGTRTVRAFFHGEGVIAEY